MPRCTCRMKTLMSLSPCKHFTVTENSAFELVFLLLFVHQYLQVTSIVRLAILSNNFILEFARNEDGRLRMRADINMEGPEYSGRKSSRLAAFESNGEELPVNQSLMDVNGKSYNFEYEDEDDDDLLVCTYLF